MSNDLKNIGRGSAVSFASPANKDRAPLADVIRHEAVGTSPKALPQASNVPGPMSKGKERISSLRSSTDAVSMMGKKNEDRHGKRDSARFFGKIEAERDGDGVLVVEEGGARKRRANVSIDDSVETDSISTWGTSDNSREDTEGSSNDDDAVPEPLNVLYYTFFQLCKMYKLHKGCTHLKEFFGHWTDQVGLDQMDIYPDMKVLNLSEAYIGVKHLMILGDMLRVDQMDRFHASALASAYVKLPPNLPDTFSFSRLPELECINLSHMCLDFNIDERQRLRLRPEDWALLPSSMVFSPKKKKALNDDEEEEAPFFPYTNKISGNAGVRYFLAAITGHPSLKEVDLSHNAIGAALLPALCRCIKGTPSMVRVGLEDTGLLPTEVACVEAMCELNHRRLAARDASLQKDHRKAWRTIQVQWLRKWCASVWEGHQQHYGQTGGSSANRLSDVVFSASSLLSTSVAAADTTDVHTAVKADLPTSIPPLFVSETPCITTVEPPAKVVHSIERFLRQLTKDSAAQLKVTEGRGKAKKRRGSRTPNGRRRSVSVVSSDTSLASISKDEEEPYVELPSRPTTRAWRQNSTSSVTFMSTPDPVLKTALSSTIPTAASSRGPPSTFLRHEMKYSHVFNTPFLRYLKQVEVRGGGKSSSHHPASVVGNTGFPFSPSVGSAFPSRTRSGSVRGLPIGSSASAFSTLGPSSSTASSCSTSTFSATASSLQACVLAREVEDVMKSAFVDPRVAELTFLQGRLPCATLPSCKAFGGLKGIGTARWIDGTISSMPLEVAEGLKKEVAASLLMKAIRRTLFPSPPKPKSLHDHRDGLPQRGWRAAEEERYFMLLEAQEKQWNLLLSKMVSLMQRVRVQVGDALYYENEEPYWLWFLPVDEEEEEERDSIMRSSAEGEEKMAHSHTDGDAAVQEADNAHSRRKTDTMVELHSSVIPYPSRRGSKKKRRLTDPTSKNKVEDDTDDEEEEEEEEEEEDTTADTSKRNPDVGLVSRVKERIGGSTKDNSTRVPRPPPPPPPPPPCTVQIARGQFFGDQELFGTTALYLYQRQKRLYEAALERRRQYGGPRRASSGRPIGNAHGGAPPSSTTPYAKNRGKGEKEQDGVPMSTPQWNHEGKKTPERHEKPLEPPADLAILREQHKFREGNAVLRGVCRTGGSGSDGAPTPYWPALSSEGPAGSASLSLPPLSRPLSSPSSPLFSPKVHSPPSSLPTVSSTASAFASTIPTAKADVLPGDGPLPSLLPTPTTTAAATRRTSLPPSTTIRTEGVVSTHSSNETTENGARPPLDRSAPYVTLWQLPLEVAFFYLFDPYQQLHQKAAAVVQSFPELQDMPPIVASQVGYVLQCFGVTMTEMPLLYGPSRTLAWHEDLMQETILLDEGEFILSAVSSVTGKKSEKRFYGNDVHRVVLTNEAMSALDAPYRRTVATDAGDFAPVASGRLGNASGATVVGKAAALQQYREQKEFLNQQKKKKKKKKPQEKKDALSPPLRECTAVPFSSSACEGSSLPVKSSSPDSPPSSGGPCLSFDEDTDEEEEVEYRLSFGSQASHWRYYIIRNEDWMLLPVDVRVAFSAGSVVLGNKRGNESL